MTADYSPVLAEFLDLLIDMVCVVDAEGRYVFVSAAAERLLGYRPEELLGREMLELVHPDDRARTIEAATQVMHGHSHLHFENRYLRKDGRIAHIMWSACWAPSDRVRLGVARDITDLKHAARLQNAMYRISEAAHATDGLIALYRQVHRTIADLLPAGKFFVALHDPANDGLSFPYFSGMEQSPPQPVALASDPFIAEVIRTGKSLLITSGDGQARDAPDWMAAPLTSRDRVMGALVMEAKSVELRYGEEDKELLQFVAVQLSTAIERKQQEARLHRMARHDPLTGLPNRAFFNEQFELALKHARRYDEGLALLYLDLDGFKRVNDRLGHGAGDILLCEVARRLRRAVRDSDVIARMGGDEFSLLLSNVNESRCGVVAKKVQAVLDEPFDLAGRRATILASVGTAVYPEQGGDWGQLFRRADDAMYAAKRRRRRTGIGRRKPGAERKSRMR